MACRCTDAMGWGDGSGTDRGCSRSKGNDWDVWKCEIRKYDHAKKPTTHFGCDGCVVVGLAPICCRLLAPDARASLDPKAHQSVDQVMGLWDSSQRSIVQPKACDRLTRCMHCGGTLLHHKSDGRAQSVDRDYGRRGECDVGPGHTETDEASGTREDNRPATVAI